MHTCVCVCSDKHKALVTRSEQLAVSRLTHACNVSGTHLLKHVLGDLVKTQPIAACTVISRSDTSFKLPLHRQLGDY